MAERLTPAERLDKLELRTSTGTDALLSRARSALGTGTFTEFWKYTPTADFIDGLDDIAVSRPLVTGIDQPGVTVSELSPATMSDAERAPIQDPESADRFPLADLALLLAGDLLVIDVDGSPENPIRIEHGSGLMVPVFLRLAPGARLRLSESQLSEGFCNHSVYIELAEDAELDHAFTAFGVDSCHWSLTQVHLATRSTYRRQQYQTGGRRRRSETQILLDGPEASAEVTGAYVVDDGTHLDQQLVLEHRAARTTSRQRFHGIGAGKGTAVFNGRIHIHPGAPGADASLSNRNLALSPEAVINTKPELEIYTDDVRCAHGATVGQISQDSLFYLRSRGLGPIEARRLLCRAFITECIGGDLAEEAEAGLLGDWTDKA